MSLFFIQHDVSHSNLACRRQDDETSDSFASRNHSKAFLRHLFASGERLGPQIASVHNLSFYLWLVKEARTKILEGNFYGWKNLMVKKVSTRL